MITLYDIGTINKRELARSVELVSGNHKKTRPSRRRPARGGASTTGTFPPNKCSRAVAFDPMAEILAVGMNDGSFMILDEKSLEKIAHKRGRGLSQWVQDLKFSPLDPILAVSTHDNFIDLWEYEGSNFTMIHRLRGHNSFITHIDWSSDGTNLQSNCGAYELLFWDSIEGTQVTERKLIKGYCMGHVDVYTRVASTRYLGRWSQGLRCKLRFAII